MPWMTHAERQARRAADLDVDGVLPSDIVEEEIDFAALGIDPEQPCTSPPGSEDKVLMLMARYRAGIPLWDERDAPYGAPADLYRSAVVTPSDVPGDLPGDRCDVAARDAAFDMDEEEDEDD